MSGPANNIQRDATWIIPDDTVDLTAWPSATNLNTGQVFANAKTAVHPDVGSCQIRRQMTLAQDQLECVGVYMDPPRGDNTPYRVKANLTMVGMSGTICNGAIVVGYAPASITGSDDIIDNVNIITFDQEPYDDVIMVPPLDSGDSNYGRPLFFGVAHLAGQAATNIYAFAYLSVQNLAIKPPTMQNAIS